MDRALALNLEVLGRGLAAIGNFFVFNRLPFVERRKASFLDRRNMNENILAATRGLDKSETLGRVEPLHSTFSHHVVSAGSKQISDRRPPHTGMARSAHDTPDGARLIAQRTTRFGRKTIDIGAHSRFLAAFAAICAAV